MPDDEGGVHPAVIAMSCIAFVSIVGAALLVFIIYKTKSGTVIIRTLFFSELNSRSVVLF